MRGVYSMIDAGGGIDQGYVYESVLVIENPRKIVI